MGHEPVDPCPIDTYQLGTLVDPCPSDMCQLGTLVDPCRIDTCQWGMQANGACYTRRICSVFCFESSDLAGCTDNRQVAPPPCPPGKISKGPCFLCPEGQLLCGHPKLKCLPCPPPPKKNNLALCARTPFVLFSRCWSPQAKGNSLIIRVPRELLPDVGLQVFLQFHQWCLRHLEPERWNEFFLAQ